MECDANQDMVENNNARVTRMHLPNEAKQSIVNVYEYMKNTEGEIGSITKTSRMTKVAESTVREIVK